MKVLKDLDLRQKRVLVRCDFNVPLSQQRGIILDDFRIRKTIPTIKYLKEKRAKIILMSHLGRPAEIKNEKLKIKKFSLKPIAQRLEKLLGRKVKFLDDCIGEKVEKEVNEMKGGEIIFLENLRFHKEEKNNDKNFTKKLAELGNIFINNAFSACHRNHASIVGIPKYLPSGAGFLLEKEVKILSQIIKNPKRPLVVIVSGSKIKDKAKMVERFSKIADFLLVGNLITGGIRAKKIRIKYPERVFLTIDNIKNCDIGKGTIKVFKEKISEAKTVFWAGPLGKIEEKKYQKGTKEIALAIIKSGSFSVIGGGDTVEFINKIGLIKRFNHVSTGGGAMLAFLSGEKLPGLKALRLGR